jgi:glycosyltransferase involved in cell wall biosynthesis
VSNGGAYSTLFSRRAAGSVPAVTVIVTLYNYGAYIAETLESVKAQTFADLGIVIVDDCSSDDSCEVAERWIEANSSRFVDAVLVRNDANVGPSRARNHALDITASPFVFILDADNLLYPRCIAALYAAIEGKPYAFAYPIIEEFDGAIGLIGNFPWEPQRLAHYNYIDAMALISADHLRRAGGYDDLERLGWEDYDLWCKFHDLDFRAIHVPEILARYRVHENSMLRSVTNQQANYERLCRMMMRRHPWMKLNGG